MVKTEMDGAISGNALAIRALVEALEEKGLIERAEVGARASDALGRAASRYEGDALKGAHAALSLIFGS